MDKKLAALIGAVAGIATVGSAKAAVETAPATSGAPASYADLLGPIDNRSDSCRRMMPRAPKALRHKRRSTIIRTTATAIVTIIITITITITIITTITIIMGWCSDWAVFTSGKIGSDGGAAQDGVPLPFALARAAPAR